MNNWISVKDRMPYIGEYVLFCGGDEVTGITMHTKHGLYAGGAFIEFLNLSGDGCNPHYFDEVTHWMLVPHAVGYKHG